MKHSGVEKLTIVKSRNRLKKWDAVFEDSEGRTKTVSFGAVRENGIPYTDYTMGADEETRDRYIKRHSSNEDWADYTSAGSLSRWILWGNYRDIRRNINAFKNRFNLR